MSLDAFAGILIGSGISILVTYLSHRWIEKRERQKIELERENEAISQIFSPLVFILQKARDMFARIAALQHTLQEMSKIEEKQADVVLFLSYLTAEKVRFYPQALEDLLIHKSGLIKSSQFYFDLCVLQSYLSTLVDLIQLASRSDKDLHKLGQYFSGLAPLVIQLDEAITQMRKYAMVQTARLPKQEYKQFFTEKKYAECESCLDKAHKTLTGQNILDWSSILKGLQKEKGKEDEGNTSRDEEKKG